MCDDCNKHDALGDAVHSALSNVQNTIGEQMTFFPMEDLTTPEKVLESEDDDDTEDEAETPKCPCCDCELGEDTIMHDGEPHCTECVHTCEECETTSTDDDDFYMAFTSGHGTHRGNGRQGNQKYLCDSCSFSCGDCGSRFSNDADHGFNCSDDKVCQRCAENYSSCDECNSTIHQDDSHYDERDERTLCSDCYRTNSGSEKVHDYSYKPDARFFRAAKQKAGKRQRYLGWELEVDYDGEPDNDDAIVESGIDDLPELYCKSDGSLDNGFEIVSHPGTPEYWKAFDYAFMGKLVKKGYNSFDTETCGMHVHVSRDSLSKLDLFKLLAFFRLNAKLVFKVSRRADLKKLSAYAAIGEESNAGIVRKVCEGPQSRYEAINLENRKTVEFRIFRGTLNVESFKRNLAFVSAICAFVQQTSIRKLWASNFTVWLNQSGWKHIGRSEAKSLVKWIKSTTASEDAGE